MNDKRRVMIVDDMPFMRNLLAGILAMGGYTIVAEAVGGAEAVELYRKYRPYLTLMDLHMPGMGGVEAARQIKALEAEARIILCGVPGQEGLSAPPAHLGAHGIIYKPFKAEQVLEVLQGMM